MHDLGKRLLFRLIRILLIATVLMAGLVLLHPERYLAADDRPGDVFGGAQTALLLALLVAAVGIRVWLGYRRKKRATR